MLTADSSWLTAETMLTSLFVAARIVANPISNVFQKQLAQQSAEPLFIIGATHALLTPACILLLLDPSRLHAAPAFWFDIIIAAALAVSGNVLLVYALRSGDLSVLGPINAYKALVSLVLGILLIGEIPTAMGVAGMLLIIAGSYFVLESGAAPAGGSAFSRFSRSPGVQLRFAALALSATEAVFLKKALLLSSPLTTFLLGCLLGLPLAAAAAGVLLRDRLGDQLVVLRRYWRTYLWLALTTGVMQLTTLFAFGKLQVGYALALFQLSALISVLLGHRYFQERHIRKRLVGAAIMVVGAALIVTLGRR
jgi:drug/metabolite transporter (DMT)-like permease